MICQCSCPLSLVSMRHLHMFFSFFFFSKGQLYSVDSPPTLTLMIHGTPGPWFYGSLDPLCLDMDSTVPVAGELWVCFVGTGESPSAPPHPFPGPRPPSPSLSSPPYPLEIRSQMSASSPGRNKSEKLLCNCLGHCWTRATCVVLMFSVSLVMVEVEVVLSGSVDWL